MVRQIFDRSSAFLVRAVVGRPHRELPTHIYAHPTVTPSFLTGNNAANLPIEMYAANICDAVACHS